MIGLSINGNDEMEQQMYFLPHFPNKLTPFQCFLLRAKLHEYLLDPLLSEKLIQLWGANKAVNG